MDNWVFAFQKVISMKYQYTKSTSTITTATTTSEQ